MPPAKMYLNYFFALRGEKLCEAEVNFQHSENF